MVVHSGFRFLFRKTFLLKWNENLQSWNPRKCLQNAFHIVGWFYAVFPFRWHFDLHIIYTDKQKSSENPLCHRGHIVWSHNLQMLLLLRFFLIFFFCEIVFELLSAVLNDKGIKPNMCGFSKKEMYESNANSWMNGENNGSFILPLVSSGHLSP